MPELIAHLKRRIERAGETLNIHTVFVKLKFNDFQHTTIEQVIHRLDRQAVGRLIEEGDSRNVCP